MPGVDRARDRLLTASLVTLLTAASACGGSSEVAEPDGPTGPEGEAVEGAAYVSEPVDRALVHPGAPAGQLIYVSAPPGAFRGARAVRLRNLSNGASGAAEARDGGFDPVPLEGDGDDLVEVVVIDSAGTARPAGSVPVRGKPRVLRATPGARRTDVPLNLRLGVVFTTPVDILSAQQGVRLLQDGYPVATRFERVPGSPTAVALKPLEYLPGTAYELRISTAVRDLNDQPIEREVRVPFSTAKQASGDVLSSSLTPFRDVPEPFDNVTAAFYRMRQIEVGDSLGLRADAFGRYVDEPWRQVPLDVPVSWSVGTQDIVQLNTLAGDVVRLRGHAEGREEVTATIDRFRHVFDVWVTRMPASEVAASKVLMRWELNGGAVPWGGRDVRLNYPWSAFIVTSGSGVGFAIWGEPDSPNAGYSPTIAPGRPLVYQLGDLSDWNGVGRPLLQRVAGTTSLLTRPEGEDFCPRWSPDGSHLAFGRTDSTGRRLVVRQSDGVERTIVATAIHSCPFWSPDGSRLAYVDSTEGARVLRLVGIAAGEVPVTLPTPDLRPTSAGPWSPDGSRVAVAGWPDEGCHWHEERDCVALVRVDGSGLSLLGHQGRPTDWSADGRHLLVTTDIRNNFRFYGLGDWVHIVRVDGSASRAILPGRDAMFVPPGVEVAP